MFFETGRVKEVAAGMAVVEVERQSACAKCHRGCQSSWETGHLVVNARDPFGVQIGQSVQLSVQSQSALLATFVVYGIPLLALIAGVLLGDFLGKTLGFRDGLAALVGFVGLGLALIIVRLYNNHFQRNLRNQPIITDIISDSGNISI